mmetsp:Transcript_8665/g.24908  ORF Transcript_8665/g.24908 Transcript_8665/m.24908 type:complete len:248 (+) Transcript_8665:849-1592(+)
MLGVLPGNTRQPSSPSSSSQSSSSSPKPMPSPSSAMQKVWWLLAGDAASMPRDLGIGGTLPEGLAAPTAPEGNGCCGREAAALGPKGIMPVATPPLGTMAPVVFTTPGTKGVGAVAPTALEAGSFGAGTPARETGVVCAFGCIPEGSGATGCTALACARFRGDRAAQAHISAPPDASRSAFASRNGPESPARRSHRTAGRSCTTSAPPIEATPPASVRNISRWATTASKTARSCAMSALLAAACCPR